MEDLAWQYPAEAVERAACRFCEAVARWRGKPELETVRIAPSLLPRWKGLTGRHSTRRPRGSAGTEKRSLRAGRCRSTRSCILTPLAPRTRTRPLSRTSPRPHVCRPSPHISRPIRRSRASRLWTTTSASRLRCCCKAASGGDPTSRASALTTAGGRYSRCSEVHDERKTLNCEERLSRCMSLVRTRTTI